MTSGAVRVLAEAQREHPDEFGSGEKALLEAAMTRPVEELRRVVGDWSQSVDERTVLERAEVLRDGIAVRGALAASRGSCRIIAGRGQNLREMGVAKWMCCCRRMGRAGTPKPMVGLAVQSRALGAEGFDALAAPA